MYRQYWVNESTVTASIDIVAARLRSGASTIAALIHEVRHDVLGIAGVEYTDDLSGVTATEW